jgi:TonB family protein
MVVAILAAALVPAMPVKTSTPWLSDRDYPSGAMRRKEEGPVAFSLLIAPDGRVARCTITETSRFPDLDAQTCALMTARAHFKPARDENGAAAYGYYKGGLYWRLPDRDDVPSYRYVERDDMTLHVKRLPGGAAEESVSLIAKLDQTGHIAMCEPSKAAVPSPKLVEIACQQAQEAYASLTTDAVGQPVTVIRHLRVTFKAAAE